MRLLRTDPKKRNLAAGVLVIAALVTLLMPAPAFSDEPEERIKAAFVYQFTNYIDWPDDALKPKSAFVIDVVGRSPLIDELQALAKAKTVKGRPIEVAADDGSRAAAAQVVIVNTTDEAVLARLAAKLKNTPCLIVSEGPDFARKGSMVNFFVEQGRLRFEVNRSAVTAARLHIAAPLLALARLVD